MRIIQSKNIDAIIIDGNIGVAKRVKYILEENNLINNSRQKGTTIIQQNK